MHLQLPGRRESKRPCTKASLAAANESSMHEKPAAAQVVVHESPAEPTSHEVVVGTGDGTGVGKFAFNT